MLGKSVLRFVFFGDAEDFFDGGDAIEDFSPAVVAQGMESVFEGFAFDVAGGCAFDDERAYGVVDGE